MGMTMGNCRVDQMMMSLEHWRSIARITAVEKHGDQIVATDGGSTKPDQSIGAWTKLVKELQTGAGVVPKNVGDILDKPLGGILDKPRDVRLRTVERVIWARAGERITCEMGHHICKVARDIEAGEFYRSSMFTDWCFGAEPAIGKPTPPCQCGAWWERWYTTDPRPGALQLATREVHFEPDGWR